MDSLLLGFVFLMHLSMTRGDYEHACTTSDYHNGRRSFDSYRTCGRQLTDYLFDQCGGMPYLGEDAYTYGKRRRRSTRSEGGEDVFFNGDRAHSFLRNIRSYNTGIVCECCVHSCTHGEIKQYCSSKRRKRSTKLAIIENKDVTTGVITQDKMDKFYETLAYKETPVTPEEMQETRRKMLALEAVKRQNIEKKFVQLFMLDDEKEAPLINIAYPDIVTAAPIKLATAGLGQILAASINERSNRHKHH